MVPGFRWSAWVLGVFVAGYPLARPAPRGLGQPLTQPAVP